MKIILGTMTFGGRTTTETDATVMVSEFVEGTLRIVVRERERNSKKKTKMVVHEESSSSPPNDDDDGDGDVVDDNDIEIDTAIMYQNGQTEHILGRILPKLDNVKIDDVNNNNNNNNNSPAPILLPKIKIASKANPFTRDKNLSPTNLRQQLESSLQALGGVDSVDLYYLHAPDVHHDIEPTLEEIQLLYKEGKFKRFGLSNFTAWETVYIHNYMSQPHRQQYVVPTVYQGMYNALARQVETELFPALRKLNMSFYAYNPLAAGMLTGKYSNNKERSGGYDDDDDGQNDDVAGTRFAGKSFWAKRYRERYQQKEQFDAVDIIRQAIDDYNNSIKKKKKKGQQQQLQEQQQQQEEEEEEEEQEEERLTMTDASLRWLKYHSSLDTSNGDGIIVGASSVQHFRTNWKSLTGCCCESGTESDFHESRTVATNTLLPPEIVKAFEDAWMTCKNVCPDYSRGYSGSATTASVAAAAK